MPENRTKKLFLRIFPPVLWAFVPVAYFFLSRSVGSPECAFKSSFGIPCPGCGLGHCLEAFSSGNIIDAIMYYPASAPFGLLYGSIGLGLVFGKKSIFMKERTLLILFFLALIVLLVHWIYELAVI